MLSINMKKISMFKYSLIMMLVILILPCYTTASSEDTICNNIITTNCQQNTVSFYIHAYSFNGSITNKSLPVFCHLKNVTLKTLFSAPFALFINRFKIWNETGLIDDFTIDHCYFRATNFTGIIFHRRCLFGYAWFIYGSCDYFRTADPYN
jgi:hypothetical protein